MNYSRRQFLGVLGAGAVAGAGLSRPASAQEIPVVEMGNNYFDPIGLHVDPGTTVRFEIAAGGHSATAYEDRIPADASAFDSGVISSGGFEYTFDEPGTYDYFCIPHESVGMVGRVVVRPRGVRFRRATCPRATRSSNRAPSRPKRARTTGVPGAE
jgi:plastocyanin